MFISRLNSAGRFISARRTGGTSTEGFNAIAIHPTTHQLVVVGGFQGTADFDPGPGVVNKTFVGGDDIFILGLRQNELSGRVWNDLDSDGLYDAEEPGIENALAEILVSFNGTIGDSDDRVLATVATNGDGDYRFVTPHEAAYYVRILPPSGSGRGYQFTVADAGNDALDSDVQPTLGRTNLYNQTPGVPLANVSAGLREVDSDLAFAFGLGGGGISRGARF